MRRGRLIVAMTRAALEGRHGSGGRPAWMDFRGGDAAAAARFSSCRQKSAKSRRNLSTAAAVAARNQLFFKESGAAYVTRTRDPVITNDVLYQLS
jgi:hypothetical protein